MRTYGTPRAYAVRSPKGDNSRVFFASARIHAFIQVRKYKYIQCHSYVYAIIGSDKAHS